MLTSFFSKSKPINFLLLSLLLFLAYIVWFFLNPVSVTTVSEFVQYGIEGIVLVFLVLLLDFIVRKNNLTYKNNFAILLFVCFILMLPSIFSEQKIIYSNLFLMLAFRRIVSLNSHKNTIKKVLDASLYITVAAILNFWSLLFFVLLYLGILQYSKKTFNLFLIPFVGFLTVFILATVYFLVLDDSLLWFTKLDYSIGLYFSAYREISLLITASVLIALSIWTIFYKIKKIKTVPKKEKFSYLILIYALPISMLIASLVPTKTGAEFFFIIPSLAIITTNYIEHIEEKWFKEVLLWLLIVLPIYVFSQISFSIPIS